MRNCLSRMRPFVSETGYPTMVPYSVQLKSALNQRFSCARPATPVNTNQRKATASIWFKRTSNFSAYQHLISWYFSTAAYGALRLGTSDQLEWLHIQSGTKIHLATARMFRDIGHWYHVVLHWDTAQATAADRAKIIINGEQETNFGVATYPALNETLGTPVGYYSWSQQLGFFYPNYYNFDGYIAQVHVFDGAIVPASEFGEFNNGTWVPKSFGGGYSYGNLGYAHDFADAGDISKDVSGNAQNFATNGTPLQSTDTPTNNYPTLNSLIRTIGPYVSRAGTRVTVPAVGRYSIPVSQAIPKTGKWKIQVSLTTLGNYAQLGVVPTALMTDTFDSLYGPPGSWTYYGFNGNLYYNQSLHTSGYGPALVTGDIWSIVVDMDAGVLRFYEATTQRGTDISIDTDIEWVFFVASHNNSAVVAVDLLHTPEEQTYTSIEGSDICSAAMIGNLTLPANSKKGTEVVLRTGTGAAYDVTGLQINLDAGEGFVWSKAYSGTYSHALANTVRGPGYHFNPNDSAVAELVNAQDWTSFNEDGYSLGTNARVNGSGVTFMDLVAKAHPDWGIDIVVFTGNMAGRTIAHGLGGVPEHMILRNLSVAGPTIVYHHKMHATTPEAYYMRMNSTVLRIASAVFWNNTKPTSSVFSVGADVDVNGNGNTIVAFLFRGIPGFSKFDEYNANGNANGPYVHCGFRPAWGWTKTYGYASNWSLFDHKRTPYNQLADVLQIDTQVNGYAIGVDLLSNGFKPRNADNDMNRVAETYIYAAFADQPYPLCNAR